MLPDGTAISVTLHNQMVGFHWWEDQA